MDIWPQWHVRVRGFGVGGLSSVVVAVAIVKVDASR